MILPLKFFATIIRSASSKIDSWKCAPIAARRVFGDQAKAQFFERKAQSAPAAAAERNMEPKFPASWMSSSNTPNRNFSGCIPGTGTFMIASTPAGDVTEEISLNRESGSSYGSSLGIRRSRLLISLCFIPLALTATVSGMPNTEQ